MDDTTVGANVARLRGLAGFTQADFARQLTAGGFKCTQHMLARIEAGERPLRYLEADVVKHALGVADADLRADSEADRQRAAVVGAVGSVRVMARRMYNQSDQPWKALHYAATSAFEAVEKLDREPGHDEGLVRWAWEQIAQAWGALEQSLDADAAAYYAATGEDAEDGSTFRRNDDSISEFLAFGREHGWDPEHLALDFEVPPHPAESSK